jgi:hypothetical protein
MPGDLFGQQENFGETLLLDDRHFVIPDAGGSATSRGRIATESAPGIAPTAVPAARAACGPGRKNRDAETRIIAAPSRQLPGGRQAAGQRSEAIGDGARVHEARPFRRECPPPAHGRGLVLPAIARSNRNTRGCRDAYTTSARRDDGQIPNPPPAVGGLKPCGPPRRGFRPSAQGGKQSRYRPRRATSAEQFRSASGREKIRFAVQRGHQAGQFAVTGRRQRQRRRPPPPCASSTPTTNSIPRALASWRLQIQPEKTVDIQNAQPAITGSDRRVQKRFGRARRRSSGKRGTRPQRAEIMRGQGR